MEFDISRCYSAINADELHEGDKVIVADDLSTLKEKVKKGENIETIREIYPEDCQERFDVEIRYTLAYLVERKKNCTNCGCAYCNYKERHGIDEQRLHTCLRRIEPKTKQKAEKDCDNCGQRCDGYGKGEVCSQWKSKAEKNTDYNHCEEARKAYACAMTNACPNKHYRPFRDTDELIKVWREKSKQVHSEYSLTMPYIWVRQKECSKGGLLITYFGEDEVKTCGVEA